MLETKIIYNSRLTRALREAQEYAGKDGYVASLLQLIYLRSKVDEKDELWTNWFTTTSEEHVGKTKQGNLVLVTSRGQAIWTPDRIKQAYKERLVNGAGKLTEPEFQKLLEGNVTITDLDKIKNLPSGYQSLEALRKDPLFILRVGDEERADKYLDRLKQEGYKRYGNWHLFNRLDLNQPQGCLLFVYLYDGVGNLRNLYSYGQFLVVSAPKAHNSEHRELSERAKISRPSLEQVLKVSVPFVPEIVKKDFEKTLRALYKEAYQSHP